MAQQFHSTHAVLGFCYTAQLVASGLVAYKRTPCILIFILNEATQPGNAVLKGPARNSITGKAHGVLQAFIVKYTQQLPPAA